jgi:DNA-binding IclR family transcriptional regulator
VKSAERVLDLIEHLGRQRGGASFGALAHELGIPKSSLHALLEVMTAREYVQHQAGQRTYSLGIRVWEAGQAYHRGHDVLREAQAILEAVVAQVNETAQLAKLVGSENVYLSKVDSLHPLRLQSEVGGRLSAHATGVGKALLAQLDTAEVRRRFGNGRLPVYTGNTIATVKALIEELGAIRGRGFAIDNEEYTPGVFCVAVPVFEATGGATIALSVTVPVLRAGRPGLAKILSVVADASVRLSQRCGAGLPHPQLLDLIRIDRARGALDDLAASGRYRLSWDDGVGA